VSPEVIEGLIRLVANGRKFGVTDAIIHEHLVEMGVPKEHAQELCREISDGLEAGARMNDGDPAPTSSTSPLYQAAMAEGKRAKVTQQQQRRQSTIVGMVVLAVVVVLVFWFTR
jgi:hypothetical protein